ncbi:MAG: hypothetical protein A2W07_07300 [candidate division Zixibacteria bacterium RBG_16_43_9]|nr:MAG: hypothetical protein A2W07_07300 [candidate division Zixibacteria bacterium RBG_16_43_9]
MRKKIILSLLLIFVFFSISSSQLLIKNPNWKNGEKFSYEIRYKDELVGSQDYLITDTLIEKTKAYQIKVATLTGYQSQNTFDSVSLIINQGNLKPLILERMIMTPQMFIKVQAIYLADKVKVKLETPQGNKETDIDFPKDGYDNEEIVLLLRALTLKERTKFTFKDVSPISATSFPVEIEVLKPEKVKVPSGEFLCNKVKMKVAGKEVELFYQKNKPNLMVKYLDNAGGTVMTLKEYK